MIAHFHPGIQNECQYQSQMLAEKGFPATVVPVVLEQYKGLAKDKSPLGKFLRKFSLDFPRTIEPGQDVQKIIFWNITAAMESDLALEKLPKDKMVLFVWEPPTVLPKMFSKNMPQYFSRIYTWEDDVIDNKT